MEKFEDVVLSYTSRVDQIVDFLTKAISRKQLNDVMSKLGMVNIYASTWGEVFRVLGRICL